jgi:alkyl hydroperoxide reductase subunit AhpC
MLPAVNYNCGDTAVDLYFEIKIDCESVALDGSDFRMTNPFGQPIPIKSLIPDCDVNKETEYIKVVLFKPLLVNGRYFLYSKTGNDGNTLTNKCGFPMDEFDTLVIIVDNCVEPVWQFENVTVVDDNHINLQWSVDGASCDTNEVHFAWLNTAKNNGGIEGVTYPLIADTTRNLSNILGILDVESAEYNEELDTVLVEGSNVTYRATYLIDETGKIFHESVNDMPLGRNVNEYLRLVDAYTHVQEKGEVCPANWEAGKDAMTADRNSTAAYLGSH